jgi:hypothetical protein
VILRWHAGTSCGHKAPFLGRLSSRYLNLVFLTDLHSFNLFKGQPVPRSIIYPGGRRTGMAGDPLRDLDGAARIHVFGDARRTEAVTTNSFQSRLSSPVSRPASRRSDDPGVCVRSFYDSCRRKEKVEHLDLTLVESVQAKDRPLL